MALLLTVMRVLARVAAFGLGLVCLFAAGAGLFGGMNPMLDVFTHFTPFWAAGAALTALIGLTLERKRVRGVLVILGLVGMALTSPRFIAELTRPVSAFVAPSAAGYTLRLIQFNAWTENADPAAAADWIDRQHPNIVTVEEATPALRAAMTARGFTVVAGTVNTAVFSRGLAVRQRFFVPPQDWRLASDFARARFAIGDTPATFTVVAVHLTWPTLERLLWQREAFARMLDNQIRDRMIVAGDFNLTPWSFGLAHLDKRLRLERRDRAIPSWPAMRRLSGKLVALPAFLPIDHIYAGPEWRTVAIRRGPRLGSDHYPLIIDLKLQP